MMGNKHFWIATATLVGTIIGVGMFSLPYVASRAGMLPFLVYLVVLGAIVTLVHLLYGEVVLRTKEKHRLIGYADYYLGRRARHLASFTLFFGLFGALLAYLVLGGQFLHLMFPELSPVAGGVMLALVGFLGLSRGLRGLGTMEFFMSVVLVGLIGALVGLSAGYFSLGRLALIGAPAFFFLPYGAVLFSLAGSSAIPEIRAFFTERPRRLRKAIIWGTVVPVVTYLFFVLAVVGMSGQSTSPDAITGLVPLLGDRFVLFGALIGFLAVLSSFFTLGVVIEDAMQLDYGWRKLPSLLIASLVPLVLFLLGARNFIEIIGWVGTVLGGLEGILILSLHRAAQRKGDRAPEYSVRVSPLLFAVLATVFAAAIIYQFIYWF
jgi:tyrosine-specific transport protein